MDDQWPGLSLDRRVVVQGVGHSHAVHGASAGRGQTGLESQGTLRGGGGMRELEG